MMILAGDHRVRIRLVRRRVRIDSKSGRRPLPPPSHPGRDGGGGRASESSLRQDIQVDSKSHGCDSEAARPEAAVRQTQES
jgi:hypothetical protein